ncbi:MAG: 3-methyl-2-oxobutanoate hydroxymethyltransferase [Anaerococcus hydrogenalis]|uniref:3-methyl-2-oxobutanoate hydroxymethyltransferase n=1 Tax=Anaerococcus hydrogenalis TaxID=33029 RepID=UPI002904A9EE|nr:3-methyl-2-oxobutanoate hydroxymethyltransferase [Anaerococcus hydrogenalis]MDU1315856.1 3-methyl-2-oxobutanoate hydroxymethyltransferase [Anaerococcus hydrogenalis]MDU2202006.1 3-methyl-2-oxobutanoate hydroxymethyltransferase [Anaerococcus hydrogenalis]MDU3688673.1 3-methyl-2-oxobutanoate hydroxymethyltransferase [Anaerococcus hydrogenalis]
MKKKMSVLDFKKYKEEKRKFAYVTAYDYTMASIVDESDVEVILVGDSLGMTMLGYDSTVPVTIENMIHHGRAVVKGAKNTFITVDMPFGSYEVSKEKAVENAVRIFKETGCDCVKLEGGLEYVDTIKAIINAGVPVMGHIGLTPQSSTMLGGFKVQGTTRDSAKKLIEDAKALEEAGCFSIVLECVPSIVGKKISQSVSVPILGIGAGKDVDCQVIVLQDVLGMYPNFKPKFVKIFANVREVMLKGLNAYHDESVSGQFPSEEYSFNRDIDLSDL